MHSYCHQQDPLQGRSRTDLHQHFTEGAGEAFKEQEATKEEEEEAPKMTALVTSMELSNTA